MACVVRHGAKFKRKWAFRHRPRAHSATGSPPITQIHPATPLATTMRALRTSAGSARAPNYGNDDDTGAATAAPPPAPAPRTHVVPYLHPLTTTEERPRCSDPKPCGPTTTAAAVQNRLRPEGRRQRWE
ncbi:hypothetical protein EDB84DRAFT_1443816 [Lactarius hengduanensis]|nr:hypothetical protein EDB84DRAFT_1443816 [Lactarius hengduanensis]